MGKSKLVERYLMDNYHPRQRSTFALTLYRHEEEVEEEVEGAGGGSSSSSSSSSSSEGAASTSTAAGGGAGSSGSSSGGAAAGLSGEQGGAGGGSRRRRRVAVDFWDTAGQERFASMHPSYYYRAHACVLVFDVTRKVTYTNLQAWYKELRQYCPRIPCICIANKIDVDYAVTSKAFAFPEKNGLPFFFVSAADGTNVVAIFQEAVRLAWAYKTKGEKDFVEEVLELIDDVRAHTAGARARTHARTHALLLTHTPRTHTLSPSLLQKALGDFGKALYGPHSPPKNGEEGKGSAASAGGAGK